VCDVHVCSQRGLQSTKVVVENQEPSSGAFDSKW